MNTGPYNMHTRVGMLDIDSRCWKGNGANNTPTLLCFHGLASNARWWDLVAARLSSRYEVICPDLRGHGQSASPKEGYQLSDLVDDAIAFLEQLDRPDVIAVGQSLGAVIALHLAAKRPRLVRGLVCVEGGIASGKALFGDTWEQARIALGASRSPAVSRSVLETWLTGSDLVRSADVETVLEILLGNFEEIKKGEYLLRLAAEHHETLGHSLWEDDPLQLWRDVTSPALAILGRDVKPHQRVAAQEIAAEQVKALCTTLAIEWIVGAHELPLESPDEVAFAIDSFVKALK